ncbi:TRAP transporter small permease [Thauera chlorobenzoica]|uniref:TRAP transporter small permease n=1 Tax=Thauera chlorobenzoica TaxID=96773 RepID=UPI00135ABB99|nr:TRAP transporter small permease [Thauera chlorobenzoica]
MEQEQVAACSPELPVSARDQGRCVWSILDRWLEGIEFFFFSLSAAAVGVMTLMIGADVALRFFTGASPGWLSDLPIFLNIMMAFLAMAFMMRRRQHIVVDLLLVYLSPSKRRVARVVTLCIAQLFFVILLYAGTRVAWRSYELGNVSYTAFEVPMFILQSAIPLGALLLVCEGISQLIKLIQRGD